MHPNPKGSATIAKKPFEPSSSRASEQATVLAHRGVDAVGDTSQQLREKAHHVSDCTVAYIRDEPVKAMPIAAATGTALMALINLVSRSGYHA